MRYRIVESSARRWFLVIRAIVVVAGEQGDCTTELAHGDFSHSPPHVNRLGRGAAKGRVTLSDQWTVAVFSFALLRQHLIV